MTHLTPDQARQQANATLAALYATVTEWDEAVLDQAILAVAAGNRTFSANDLWWIVPELGRGIAGLYFGALAKRRSPLVLQRVGYETSVNPRAHGKPVNTYRLTHEGRTFLEERRQARADERRAA
jgi:hypothetical protein